MEEPPAGEEAGDEEEGTYDPQAAFTCDWPSADLVANYRDECRRSDEVLAVTPLSAAPRGLDFHPRPGVHQADHERPLDRPPCDRGDRRAGDGLGRLVAVEVPRGDQPLVGGHAHAPSATLEFLEAFGSTYLSRLS